MSEGIDDLTANALAEETSTKESTTAPEKEAEAPVEEKPSVKESDGQIGTFEEPDYLDVVSDHDRSEDVVEEETKTRPLDPVIPEPAPVVKESEPAKPSETKVAEPQSEEKPSVAAVPPVAPIAAPAAPTPGKTPTPEEEAAAAAQLQENIIKELTRLYSFSPEEAAKLDEFEQKPSEYLPQLLAKAHQNSYAHAYQAIMEAMPQMVNTISSTNIKNQEAENAFFERWPDLKGQDEIAVRAIKTYRQMNPNTTVQEAIERAGMLAMISLGKNPNVASAPAVPDAPKTPPARPAMPGGTGGTMRTAPVTYEEGVYEEILQDEKNYGRG